LTSRKLPWARLREELVLHLVEKREIAQLLLLRAQQAIGRQGYIGPDVLTEVLDISQANAHEAVLDYSRASMPWIKWPTEEEAKAMRNSSLKQDSKELIEAWIRYFEPENAGALTEAMPSA
jgi:hypothetical protein